MDIVLGLSLITVAAVLGGFLAKVLRIPSLVGYVLLGILFGAILPAGIKEASNLAQIGTILLLFSIGVEISLDSLSRFFKVAVFGASIQVVLVTLISYLLLDAFGFSPTVSLILSFGFSISSTAILVTILSAKGEMETIHGGLMFGWSLVQDLLVIPFIVILPIFVNPTGSIWGVLGLSLVKAVGVIAGAIILGKLVVPKVIHLVASLNSREMLLLISLALALGTAWVTSLFGISPALGAFLAGVVISESQERHAIFAETRPLRDLFVALFFVTLGFFVTPGELFARFPQIIGIALMVMALKAIITFAVSSGFGFRGRTGVAASLGLAQIGEFAFVIFSTAFSLKLLQASEISLGIAVTLVTLILSPILFSNATQLWRGLRHLTENTFLSKLFSSGERKDVFAENISDHIIICGYGRVGKWVGKALGEFGIPFVVVEYNQNVVNELKEGGISVLYGDPTEPEVLEAVGIRQAKAVILAIPDRVAQETLIAYVQTVAPNVKIISRAHLDEDWEKLKSLRVDKIVQPEFEAAVEIVRSVLLSRGKTREEISEAVKSLRVSHSK